MKVIIPKKAEKQLSKFNPFVRNKILKVLKKFELGGKIDIQKMKGTGNEFRIRVGEYRILLDKHSEEYFSVTKFGKRENIYFFDFLV